MKMAEPNMKNLMNELGNMSFEPDVSRIANSYDDLVQ